MNDLDTHLPKLTENETLALAVRLEHLHDNVRAQARRRGVPLHMLEAIAHYIVRGKPGGDFLSNVLCNDLMGSYSRADDENTPAIRNWVMFLYNDAPSPCWGSPQAYRNWIAREGLMGGVKAALVAERFAGKLP